MPNYERRSTTRVHSSSQRSIVLHPSLLVGEADRTLRTDCSDEVDRARRNYRDCEVSASIAKTIAPLLAANYSTYLRLAEDTAFFDGIVHELKTTGLRKADEPWMIAVALALWPETDWEWDLARSWSWTYRYASVLAIPDDRFGDWLSIQNPESAREAVTEYLIESGRVAPRNNASARSDA